MSSATLPAKQQQPSTAIAAPKFDPRVQGFGAILKAPNFQATLRQVLPRSITPERMIRVVLSAMTQSPKLLECTPESVLLSILRAASMGLEPDGGALGQGYLVPFWNGKTRRRECQFIPGFRGLVKLARNSGEIADVWADVVYAADEFSYEKGLHPTLRHKPNDEVADRGALKYAYAVARFRDGERKFEVLNYAEVQKIKELSQSKNQAGELIGPWVEHEAEMWKKTAVRRLCKLLPLSTDPAAAAAQAAAIAEDVPSLIDLPAPALPELAAPTDEPPPSEPEPEMSAAAPQPQFRGDLSPDEMADLRKGAEFAGLPGLALQSTLKSMFGKDELEQLTQAEGKKFRQYLETRVE